LCHGPAWVGDATEWTEDTATEENVRLLTPGGEMWEWLAPVLGAIGGFLTVAVPLYIKLRQDAGQRINEVEKRAQESQRKERRDAIAEWQQVVEDLRQDRESDRKLVHDLRGDLQLKDNQLAICNAQRQQAERERDYWRDKCLGPQTPEATSE
jgi:hypothetical protein